MILTGHKKSQAEVVMVQTLVQHSERKATVHVVQLGHLK